MIARIFRRTPYARDTKLSAPTLDVVVRAVHLAPSVTATDFNAPATLLGMLDRLLNFLFWMPRTAHGQIPDAPDSKAYGPGCQLTTGTLIYV